MIMKNTQLQPSCFYNDLDKAYMILLWIGTGPDLHRGYHRPDLRRGYHCPDLYRGFIVAPTFVVAS